jgi:hypothetical protein
MQKSKTKPNERRKKEVIKMRAKIKKSKTKTGIRKMNEVKS